VDTARLDYLLPDDLIATRPAEPRDASRLLVVSRTDPHRLEHRAFRDLPDLLSPDDLLVFNRSAVLPARLRGRREETGGRIEGLYLDQPGPGVWTVLLKSNGRLRQGLAVRLELPSGDDTPYRLRLLTRDAEAWRVEVERDGADLVPDAPVVLADVGATPLPPYILGRREKTGQSIADELDRRWYQTVYAAPEHAGSVAAPTAGLHFTPGLLDALAARGVRSAWVTLHVGAGTFRPIEAERLEDHQMHAERFAIPPETLGELAATRSRGGARVAVGTTSVRAIESIDPDDRTGAPRDTSLFISPGFNFRHTDALITNFHLPRSSLLALVGAFLPEGVDRLLGLYRVAVEERYRFYSFGDAMLILP
jgi:S-adenosylmethionine:tRNA ribosyltransferase-isomerase